MITEDYVSFEIAKLLKKKGFNIPCNCYGAYNGVNLTYRLCITDKYTNWNKHTDKFIISCPTLQMVMKWLREVHKVNIEIHYNRFGENYKYLIIYKPEALDDIRSLGVFYYYEEACEAAIKYCLENLI